MKDIAFKLYRSFSLEEKNFFYLLLILMFFAMLLEALSIGLVFPLLTFIIDDRKVVNIFENIEILTILNLNINFSQNISLNHILFFLITIYLVKNIFLLYQTYLQARFSSFLGIQKSQSLYKKYIASPYSFHIVNNSAFLLRNITEEVGNYCGAVIILMRIMTELIVLIGLAILLIIINPIITLNTMLIFGLILFFYQNITKKLFLKWGKQKQQYFGERIIAIQQTFGAYKELKILNRFEKFYDKFKEKNDGLYNINIKNETLNSVPKYLIETLLIIIIALILIYFAFNEDLSSSIPLLGLMAAASFRILPSINRIINYIQELRYFNASLGLVTQEFNDLSIINKNHNDSLSLMSFNKDIKFANVNFSYENYQIFKNLNMKINLGDTIGIIGDSGSGKSTFLDLLIGLHNPSEGKILVDNIDINSNINGWFKNIGYVSQNVYLIDDTIENNIALGINDKEIDYLNLDKAIDSSGLKDFIQSLKNGLNTIVGENGVSLSGGQRQRIGIARALYHNPKILILDEATSSLDETNEKNILKFIFNLEAPITVVIVSHNKSNLYNCDVVYKVEKKNLIKISQNGHK